MRFGSFPSFRNQPAEAQAGRNPARKSATDGRGTSFHRHPFRGASHELPAPATEAPNPPLPRPTWGIRGGNRRKVPHPTRKEDGPLIHASWPQDHGFPNHFRGERLG